MKWLRKIFIDKEARAAIKLIAKDLNAVCLFSGEFQRIKGGGGFGPGDNGPHISFLNKEGFTDRVYTKVDL